MKIYVYGFVTHGGIGGFEWRYDRTAAEKHLQSMRDGDGDYTEVRELDTVADLGVESQVRDEETRQAITEALQDQPELWEPAETAEAD